MTTAKKFYEHYSKIFDACLPVLKDWLAERGYRIVRQHVVREPDPEEGWIAAIWVYAELYMSDGQGDSGMMRVVVLPSGMLDIEGENNQKGVFSMVFITLGYGDNSDPDGLPVIFTDRNPKRFLENVKQRTGLNSGNGIYVVTPERVL